MGTDILNRTPRPEAVETEEPLATESAPPSATADWETPVEGSMAEVREAVQDVVDSFRLDSSRTVEPTAGAAPPEPAPDLTIPTVVRGRAWRLLTAPLRLLASIIIGVLSAVDVPFGFLGAQIKTLIGWLALSTALLAAGVWLYGPKLAKGLNADVPASQPAAQTAPANVN